MGSYPPGKLLSLPDEAPCSLQTPDQGARSGSREPASPEGRWPGLRACSVSSAALRNPGGGSLKQRTFTSSRSWGPKSKIKRRHGLRSAEASLLGVDGRVPHGRPSVCGPGDPSPVGFGPVPMTRFILNTPLGPPSPNRHLRGWKRGLQHVDLGVAAQARPRPGPQRTQDQASIGSSVVAAARPPGPRPLAHETRCSDRPGCAKRKCL